MPKIASQQKIRKHKKQTNKSLKNTVPQKEMTEVSRRQKKVSWKVLS